MPAPVIQRRYITAAIENTTADTVAFSFSSETPVARGFGDEVLSHAPGAADLSRLNDGAPLLWNHDPGQMLGVIESATIANGKGRAVARWGTTPEALQRRADVEAGILRNVSVGYVVHRIEQRGTTYVATRWEALEISLVSVAADPSVGIGRSQSGQNRDSNPHAMADHTIAESPSDSANVTEALADLTRQVKLLQVTSRKVEPIQTGSELYGDATLPLSDREQKSYSLIRALKAAATGDWSGAGFERECSRALEQQTGRAARGFLFPANLQVRAPYVTTTANAAGNLVATDLMAEQFIDALRKRLLVAELGATMLPGLVGNVAIPRRSGLTASYWVAEGSNITAASGTFDQVTMSPKTVGCLSSWTRVMSLQSTPAIEELVRADLVQQVASAIDLAAINGSGSSNQPRGVLNTTGIGSVVGGTNGAAITFDHLADLKREVAIDDADTPTAAYLTNAKVEAKLSKIQASGSGEYLLGPGSVTSGTPASLWGRRFAISNQVPGTLTKGSASGTCSAVVYGNFRDLLIGMWGATDVLVNPFGSGYSAGDVEIRVMQTVDVAVRHPESFAAMVDALT